MKKENNIEKSKFVRIDERGMDEIRQTKISRNYTKYADGSVLIEIGNTKVICTASVEEGVPAFLKGSGSGWITAEYSMLPSATEKRKKRDSTKGKVDGRSQEIQRLIGRSIRSTVNMDLLGERTIWIDCDVIQADGGTRTASITGAFVALVDALYKLYKKKIIKKMPIDSFLSAISVGIVDGEVVLDMCYEEDSKAESDANVVMTNRGEFIEIQATGEQRPFKKEELEKILKYAEKGNRELMRLQREALGEASNSIIGKEYEKEAILATGNKHKLEEIKEMLSDIDFKIDSLKDVGLESIEIIENGRTFEHNALIKARTIAKKTGKIAIGDDSGIEVDALDKRPGVYSARYAGENATDAQNREKMFEELEGIELENRKARFVCVIAVVFPDGEEILSRGVVEGKIDLEEKGENGFGYDCMFIPEGYNKTFGELSSDIKNSLSHRGRALEDMKIKLKKTMDSRTI
ncbi:ribonuclease PH [Peptostreptococcus faecalis]|uniref:ribonuclease PH n=1 Tax=Peptostreptococcus faecalis TaxID=2045015 RepID=UPI000C7C9C3F|nr:ribonuclease PH [Peptostreptococcus faecalis]